MYMTSVCISVRGQEFFDCTMLSTCATGFHVIEGKSILLHLLPVVMRRGLVWCCGVSEIHEIRWGGVGNGGGDRGAEGNDSGESTNC